LISLEIFVAFGRASYVHKPMDLREDADACPLSGGLTGLVVRHGKKYSTTGFGLPPIVVDR
jgi:hypothetical protein